ncbi:protein kinase [Phlyctema vagabunda]|uniref:Protein kinase n=1 Tax=Phlyctema vagabunda TaxID=108571 RepID=A0ABR4PW62_9HELO
MEPVGLAIGVVGLLAGLKGAVDGFNLLRDIFDKENDLRFMAVGFQTETTTLERWGEHFRVHDQASCLLRDESPNVRTNIAHILAEITVAQQRASRYLVKYKVQNLKAPAVGSVDEAFFTNSAWIQQFRVARDKVKQSRRISWTTGDKDGLKKILAQLRAMNDDLWRLTRATEADAVRLVTAHLGGMRSDLSRLAVQQKIKEDPDSLLALSAQLRELEHGDVSVVAKQAIRLKSVTVPGSPTATEGRMLGYYTPDGGVPKPILVEWKGVEATSRFKDDIILRIKALGTLLSVSQAPEFHRPTCLGIFDDEDYEQSTRGARRIAFVFERPTEMNRVPKSLADLVQEASKTKLRPALGERFHLAYKLASAMSLLHASNWLHKSFRSDNILFKSNGSIAEPLILGFQYSRPRGDASLETQPRGKPEIDMYYHPDVPNGWSKVKDIYSLGIVLWEIANWRPAFEERFRKMTAQKVSDCLLEELEGDDGRVWDGLVGKVYMDVVRLCLKGDFGVASGNSDVEAQMLGTSFFLDVVSKLESCKA